MTDNQTTVITTGLRIAFGGHEILKGVDFTSSRGEVTVILGRSGSGKTTFLRSLNRINEMVGECAQEGTVRILIEKKLRDIYRERFPIEWLRRKVGMVFQSPNVLRTSVEKNIALPLRKVAGVGRGEVADRVEEALREVHLWDEVKDRLHAPAEELSGGQQQRLCLARALALKPEVLLLDEPTSSLDMHATSRIEDLILELKERYTFIAVSHSPDQAYRIADVTYVLKEGLVSGAFRREEGLSQKEFYLATRDAF